METLTNTIEAILFAAGKAVALKDMAEKLGATEGEIKKALQALKARYGEDGGIQLLEFNKKAQLGSNPKYKEGVSAVLNPIREKELTRTILETAAIVAYKQPITRTEIELLRGLNSDYAVNALLELKLIYPCGRKDAVGRPVLFATTDEFLKRFKLRSLQDLPDYDTLMAAIPRTEEEHDTYLYARDSLPAEGEEQGGSAPGKELAEASAKAEKAAPKRAKKAAESAADGEDGENGASGGYEIPDFLRGLDDADIVKIS